MPTLNIEGQKVKVDDSFLQLSPEEQNATVEEIAQSLGVQAKQQGPQQQERIPAPSNALNSATMGSQAGMMFNFDDEIGAALMTPIEMGIDAFQGKGFDPGRSYNQALEKNRGIQKQAQADNPIAYGAGEVLGGITSAGAAGGNLVNAPTLGMRALQSAGIAGAQGALHGAGSGETMEERGQNAAIGGLAGGVIGGAAPYVGNKVANMVRSRAQNKLISEAAKKAPSAKELKGVASSLFDASEAQGITLNKGAVQKLYNTVQNKVALFRPNAGLDPKATGALRVLKDMTDDVMRPGSNVAPDIKDLHILRQAAQRAAISSEGRDAAIAGNMVEAIDDFITKLKPSDIAGGMNPKAAGNALMKGISTWKRASKAQVIEEAIEAAKDQASGFENGLRVQFRKILNSKRLSRGFTQAEKDAMKQVVQGTTGANLAKLIGKFGFGHGQASNMLGGSIAMTAGGAFGGLPGALGAAALGKGGRIASEKLTEQSAKRALGAISQGGVKSLPMIDQSRQTLTELLTRSAAPTVGR